MKKLMYLLAVGVLFTFTACGGGEPSHGDDNHECRVECHENSDHACAEDCADYVGPAHGDDGCAADCQKACCLGCKASDGDAKCKQDHSCCADNDDVDIEYSEDHNHDHNEGHDHNHE